MSNGMLALLVAAALVLLVVCTGLRTARANPAAVFGWSTVALLLLVAVEVGNPALLHELVAVLPRLG